MSRDIAPFGLRMPAELKETLEKHAKENKRSLNAEIVSRLEWTAHSFEGPDPDHTHAVRWSDVTDRIKAADERLDQMTADTQKDLSLITAETEQLRADSLRLVEEANEKLAALSRRVEDDRSVVDRLLDRAGLGRK